jgi:hypothetical protein
MRACVRAWGTFRALACMSATFARRMRVKKKIILGVLEDALGMCKGVCNVILVRFRRKVTHVVCENLSGKKAHEALSTFSAQHYVRSEWITDSIQRGYFPNVLSASAPAQHSVASRWRFSRSHRARTFAFSGIRLAENPYLILSDVGAGCLRL